MKRLIAIAALLLVCLGWLTLHLWMSDPQPALGNDDLGRVSLPDGEPAALVAELPAPVAGGEARQAGELGRLSDENEGVAPAAEAAIVVELRDALGAPVADRLIMLQAAFWASSAEPSVIQRSDSTGRAVFSGLTRSHYSVVDCRGSKDEAVVLQPGRTETLRWTLSEDVVIRGRVLDQGGEPVAGAGIWTSLFGGATMAMSLAVQSDAKGDFALACSPGAALQAARPGQVPSSLYYVQLLPETEPGVREVTLTLGGLGVKLRGRVVDALGDPVEGASVVVRSNAWSTPGREGGALAPRSMPALSDGEGRFETAFGMPIGEQTVIVRAAGFAVTKTSVVVGEGPVEVELVLHRGVEVSGTVLRPDGTPASQAHVWSATPGSRWQKHGDGLSPTARCDSEGHFALPSVPAGVVEVRAEAGWEEELSRGVATVEVTDHSIADFSLQLDVGRAIRGRTVDDDGFPVQGMVVTAFRHPLESNDVVTGADGSFNLTSLPEPQGRPDRWEVVVRAWTGATTRTLATLQDVSPDASPVDIVVERIESASGTIRGRIVADAGRIPGDVQAFLGEQSSNNRRPLAFDQDTGVFSTDLLRPGSYRVQLERAGIPVTAKSGLDVAAGESIDAGPISVDDGGAIEVRPSAASSLSIVAGELDRLFRGASASLVGPGGHQVWLNWQAGTWRHRGTLEPGTWRVMVFATHLFVYEQGVQVQSEGTTIVDIDVEPGRQVKVQVELPEEPTWSEVHVTVRDDANRTIYDLGSMPREALKDPTRTHIRWTVPLGTVHIKVTTDTEVGAEKAAKIEPGDGEPQIVSVEARRMAPD